MKGPRKELPFPVWSGLGWILLVSAVTAALHATIWQGTLPENFSPGHQLRSLAEGEGIPIVDRGEVREMIDSGSHLLLDARPQDQYQLSHIPTSMSLPVSDYEMGMAQLAGFLEPSMPLVVYCTGPDCDEALRLALRLREDGFTNLTLFPGGMRAWEEAE